MRLVAISVKAKGALKERMGGNPRVKVVDRQGGKVLVSAASGQFCTWVDLAKDPDWLLVVSERG